MHNIKSTPKRVHCVLQQCDIINRNLEGERKEKIGDRRLRASEMTPSSKLNSLEIARENRQVGIWIASPRNRLPKHAESSKLRL